MEHNVQFNLHGFTIVHKDLLLCMDILYTVQAIKSIESINELYDLNT